MKPGKMQTTKMLSSQGGAEGNQMVEMIMKNVRELQELEQRELHISTQTVHAKTAFIVILVISNIFK